MCNHLCASVSSATISSKNVSYVFMTSQSTFIHMHTQVGVESTTHTLSSVPPVHSIPARPYGDRLFHSTIYTSTNPDSLPLKKSEGEFEVETNVVRNGRINEINILSFQQSDNNIRREKKIPEQESYVFQSAVITTREFSYSKQDCRKEIDLHHTINNMDFAVTRDYYYYNLQAPSTTAAITTTQTFPLDTQTMDHTLMGHTNHLTARRNGVPDFPRTASLSDNRMHPSDCHTPIQTSQTPIRVCRTHSGGTQGTRGSQFPSPSPVSHHLPYRHQSSSTDHHYTHTHHHLPLPHQPPLTVHRLTTLRTPVTQNHFFRRPPLPLLPSPPPPVTRHSPLHPPSPPFITSHHHSFLTLPRSEMNHDYLTSIDRKIESTNITKTGGTTAKHTTRMHLTKTGLQFPEPKTRLAQHQQKKWSGTHSNSLGHVQKMNTVNHSDITTTPTTVTFVGDSSEGLLSSSLFTTTAPPGLLPEPSTKSLTTATPSHISSSKQESNVLLSLTIPSSSNNDNDEGDEVGVQTYHHVPFTTTTTSITTMTGFIIQALQHLEVSKRYHAEDNLAVANTESGSVSLTLESSLRSFPEISLGGSNHHPSTPMTVSVSPFLGER